MNNYSKKIYQYGAGEEFKPDGGFPPIYISDKPIKKEDNDGEIKPREYSTHKTAVSIKDIMQKRSVGL
jgi:hypothetical protein